MSSDRTAEIWSTRLQRELLALLESSKQEETETTTTTTTTEEKEDNNDDSNNNKGDNDEDNTKQNKKATTKKANADIALLPPFIKLSNKVLNIEEGICKVTFDIEVCPKLDEKKDDDDEKKKVGIVSITLDVSLERNADTGEPYADPDTYPFQKPKAILASGQELFPLHSDISNGDCITVDCDWTPSLCLSDAALNISLKIRESARKGFPFRKVEVAGDNINGFLDDNNNNNGSIDAEDNDNTILSWITWVISSTVAAISQWQHNKNKKRIDMPIDIECGNL